MNNIANTQASNILMVLLFMVNKIKLKLFCEKE